MIGKENGFVKLVSFYNEKISRSVEGLSSVYNECMLLEDKILQLTNESLNFSSISGKKVLLKPNWVRHQVLDTDRYCLTTEEAVLIALVNVLVKYDPARITIGDAPIQGCKWDKLITGTFISNLEIISKQYNIPIVLKDFRRKKLDVDNNILEGTANDDGEFVIFDLKERSYLEDITSSKENNFRVTMYDPDRLAESHRPGVHKYCITKELFEADVIISVPKVKTHQKAGLTAALKNLVGLNGDKDFLPHHRIGGTKQGGDSYPGNNPLRYVSELLLDKAYKKIGYPSFKFWSRLASAIWKISLPGPNHQMAAAWFGNDTTWRMVLDLNLIALYGKTDGTISETPQRILFSLCDGIVGGQGDGPLKPEPLALGFLGFTNNSALIDLCFAELMQLKSERIPLLKNAMLNLGNINLIYCDGMLIKSVNKLSDFSIKTKLPPGWVGYDAI